MTAELADVVLNRCAHCGLSIWRGRGGWRHTASGLRVCHPVTLARLATPRAMASKTSAVALAPRSAAAGSVPCGSPRPGTHDGLGRLLSQGQRSRPGPARPMADEIWGWQTAKEFFPELAEIALRWLELGDRVYLAMRSGS